MVQDTNQTDWDDLPSGGNFSGDSKNFGKISWTKLKSGTNIMRVFTKPEKKAVHKIEIGEKAVTVDCSDPKNKIDCSFCEDNVPIKYHALVGAINRSTKQAEIFEVKPQMINKIKVLKQTGWTDITSFDMNVVVNPNSANAYYDIIPNPQKALTAEDLELIKGFDEEQLKTRALPPSREKVIDRLRFLQEKFGGTVQTKAESASTKADKQTTKVVSPSPTDGKVPEFPSA